MDAFKSTIDGQVVVKKSELTKLSFITWIKLSFFISEIKSLNNTSLFNSILRSTIETLLTGTLKDVPYILSVRDSINSEMELEAPVV